MKFKEPISNIDELFHEQNDLFFILNATFQETLPLLNITINQTAWFDIDRWVLCIFHRRKLSFCLKQHCFTCDHGPFTGVYIV